ARKGVNGAPPTGTQGPGMRERTPSPSRITSEGGEQMRGSTHHPLQSERLRSLSCLFLRVQ
ncbi:hypothetical protein U0070_020750, partial [Myodes glareolus]